MRLSRFLSVCFLLLYATISQAQYKVSDIPEELKEGAQLVVRKSDYLFTVFSEKKGQIKVKQAFTVLKREGNSEANFYQSYDNDRKITSLSAKFYDSEGRVFEKFKKTDFKDVKYGDGVSLYDDSRLVYFRPNSSTYPFTIEYEYTMETDKLLFYPTWIPVDDEKISLQEGSFTIVVPGGHKFRYRGKNMKDPEPSISTEGGTDIYQWKLQNIKPVQYEPYISGYADIFPVLFTAPNKFSYEGYEGNFETWNDYARWHTALNEDRDDLSEENQAKVKSLISNQDTDLEKTRKIYEFLQENTRYVGIQLGIGGFQSFPADETAETGYGDCKALTTFTKGMLKAADIESYYVLVRAGRGSRPIESDFPSQQFNHVFLCVPIKQDTVWLECTSQTTPFGYVGSFTGNREVLVVNDHGGKIVKTPTYTEKDNLQLRSARVTLLENGDAFAKINTVYQGVQYENDGINRNIRKSKEDQKKWLYGKIDIPSFEITGFSFAEERSLIPSITEDLEINMRKFSSISGKRIFIKPNLMNKYSYLPPDDEDRKSDILIKSAWTDIDSITYIIPEGYYVESQLSEKSIQADFGSYEVKVIQNSPTELVYIRKMVKYAGTFPADQYGELRDFLKQVVRADKRKLVFAKKT